MKYCSSCGSKVSEDARFCSSCGAAIIQSDSGIGGRRQKVYDGVVYKCPQCGEALPSQVAYCPSCGHELRETSISHSISALSSYLKDESDSSNRARVIKAYAIPNTREDIIEFLMLAVSNMGQDCQENEFEAWVLKSKQCIQKGRVALESNKQDLMNIDELAKEIEHKESQYRARKMARFILLILSKFLGFIVSFLLIILGFITMLSGGNGSVEEIVGVIVLCISAGFASPKQFGVLSIPVSIAAGICAFILAFIIDVANENASVVYLAGIICFVIAGSHLFAWMKNPDGQNRSNSE